MSSKDKKGIGTIEYPDATKAYNHQGSLILLVEDLMIRSTQSRNVYCRTKNSRDVHLLRTAGEVHCFAIKKADDVAYCSFSGVVAVF